MTSQSREGGAAANAQGLLCTALGEFWDSGDVWPDFKLIGVELMSLATEN